MVINTDDIVTPANAADILGCTRGHVYKLIQRRMLQAVEIDGVTFVRRADLNPSLVTPRVSKREEFAKIKIGS